MPDGVFGYGSILFRRLFDDSREVATTAVFHEHIYNSSVYVNASVVVSYNVAMVKVLENASALRVVAVSRR